MKLYLATAAIAALFSAAAGPKQPYTQGHFVFQVDGAGSLGVVTKVSGGDIKAEVATQKSRTPKISSITVQSDIAMGKDLLQWIQSSFRKEYMRKNGSIVAADFDYKAKSRRELIGMHISKVTFPALDGSSKDPAKINIEITVDDVKHRKGDGKKVQGAAGPKQKKWMVTNYRFELGDLPCERVAKIDSFSWKAPKPGTKQRPKVSTVRVHVPTRDFKTWRAAAAKPTARNGTLTLQTQDHFCRIALGAVTVARVRAPKKGADVFQADLRAKSLKLECGPRRTKRLR